MKGRYQLPVYAKFNRPDPMRDWDWLRPHTLNLYEYCGNDPINGYDPDGFVPFGAKTEQTVYNSLTRDLGLSQEQALGMMARNDRILAPFVISGLVFGPLIGPELGEILVAAAALTPAEAYLVAAGSAPAVTYGLVTSFEIVTDTETYLPSATPPGTGMAIHEGIEGIIEGAFKGPAKRHFFSSITDSSSTLKRSMNSVIDEGVDVAGDVAAINSGAARSIGNGQFEVN